MHQNKTYFFGRVEEYEIGLLNYFHFVVLLFQPLDPTSASVRDIFELFYWT